MSGGGGQASTTFERHDLVVREVAYPNSKQTFWRAECSCGWRGKCRDDAVAARQVAVEKHPLVLCPTPWKMRFPDRCAADLNLLEFWRSKRWGKQPTRVYECDCGHWHTTSTPRRS